MKILLIACWRFSCCQAVFILSRTSASHCTLLTSRLVVTRSWDGTQPGQLTPVFPRDIPYGIYIHWPSYAGWPVYILGGKLIRVYCLITAWALAYKWWATALCIIYYDYNFYYFIFLLCPINLYLFQHTNVTVFLPQLSSLFHCGWRKEQLSGWSSATCWLNHNNPFLEPSMEHKDLKQWKIWLEHVERHLL